MTKTTARLAAALFSAVALSTTVLGGARAQQPPVGGAPGGAPMQDPLGLSADQKKKIDAIQKKYKPQIEALQKKWQPQFLAIQKKYQALAQPLAKDNSPAGQKKQQDLMAKMQGEMKPLMDKAMKETKPLQDKVTKEINTVLTPKQQATLKQLLGGMRGPGM